MSEPTVTVADAAQALGITEKAVRRRIERGALPAVKEGGRLGIPASAVGIRPEPLTSSTTTRFGRLPADEPSSGELLDRVVQLARENGELRARRGWLRRWLDP